MSMVCVVGLGYIGFLIVVMFVSRGYDVVGFDINEKVVEFINVGKFYFYEFDF